MTTMLHNATRIRDLLDDLESEGYPVRELLQRHGITRSRLDGDEARLPIETTAALFEAAAQMTGDDTLALKRAQSATTRRGGLISYVGRAAPTLRDLVLNLARYRRVFSDAIEMDVSRLDRDGALIFYYHLPAAVPCGQLIEFNAVSVTRGARKLTNRALNVQDISFTHPRNRHVAEFSRFFGCPARFGAESNMIRFRLQDLTLPLRTADPGLHRILKGYCEDILRQRQDVRPIVASQVERQVMDRLSTGEARQDLVAAALGMSSRTLARRLSEEGTSFKGIVETLREALAGRYLRDSDMSLTEIAFLLGYSDASSFSTAYRRWTGKPPREVRAQA